MYSYTPFNVGDKIHSFIIKEVYKTSKGCSYLCECCCGRLIKQTHSHITKFGTRSCGCRPRRKYQEIEGKIYLQCSRCEEFEPCENFSKSTGHGIHERHSECKDCSKKRKQEYTKHNADKIKEQDKISRAKNKNKIRIRAQKYYQTVTKNDPDLREKRRKRNQKHYYKNPSITAWRRLLKNFIQSTKYKKKNTTHKVLEYSAEKFRKHIESLWTPRMSWDNYGEWHIDHIKRVAEFPLETPPSIVNALSNLRPLWATSREVDGVLYEGNLNRPKLYRDGRGA